MDKEWIKKEEKQMKDSLKWFACTFITPTVEGQSKSSGDHQLA